MAFRIGVSRIGGPDRIGGTTSIAFSVGVANVDVLGHDAVLNIATQQPGGGGRVPKLFPLAEPLDLSADVGRVFVTGYPALLGIDVADPELEELFALVAVAS